MASYIIDFQRLRDPTKGTRLTLETREYYERIPVMHGTRDRTHGRLPMKCQFSVLSTPSMTFSI
jgi:hypothetical protein